MEFHFKRALRSKSLDMSTDYSDINVENVRYFLSREISDFSFYFTSLRMQN